VPKIDEYLTRVLERRGSDLHFLAGDPPRIRVYGDLTPLDPEPLGMDFVRDTLLEIMPKTAVQRFEAMARLQPRSQDARVADLVRFDGTGLHVAATLQARIGDWLPSLRPGGPDAAALAAALQAHLGDLLITFLRQVRARTGASHVCLGGSLFYHSAMNTRVRQSDVFEQVFIPVDPGNSGLAVGAALHGSGAAPALASAFLGPAYTPDEMKQVLDNCKLRYAWESDGSALDIAVDALRHGRLVGWFDGAMEWGPRALGARCILANPASPYVLENLNRFLKQREPWRGYALSGRLRGHRTWTVLASAYCGGHCTPSQLCAAAACRVKYGSARCGRARQTRSARPAIRIELTWSCS